MAFLFTLVLLFVLCALLAALLIFVSLILSMLWGSPYIGIPRGTLKQILSFGGFAKNDIFYDLGAGDARVIISAKKDFETVKVVGYEISPWPYLKGKIKIKMVGLKNIVHFERKNIFKANLSDATFVYIYLYTSFINEKIIPKLAQELKSGAKILSCSSQIDISRYQMFELVKSDLIGNIHVYLYRKI